MHSAVHKTNSRKLLVLGILVAAAAIAYLFVFQMSVCFGML